ncbi:hypothetical protein [Brevibacillus panacihumi]|uniref:Uncharacterized protein n=1 Tax=Brevibacillus panacihumi TaxID=497735 RepID=A0A3M8C982_9BACL|nr:hypothetical protein [Brevibacillus panacihumi]RNB72169.1 hypothetical protein EDM58_21950 [Brevibacillus panacihumi]
MKLNTPVNFAGRLYMPGESVKGALPLEYLEQLRANGLISEHEAESQPEKVITDPTMTEISVEEFAKLNASEQKGILDQRGIEAGSNGKERTEQYQAWLDQIKGGSDAEL